MNKIGNKIFCLITLIVTLALATEMGAEAQNPKKDCCWDEELINVTMTLTVDDNYNFLIGNKLRATKFIGSDDVWQT
jgi:hypothetical protein